MGRERREIGQLVAGAPTEAIASAASGRGGFEPAVRVLWRFRMLRGRAPLLPVSSELSERDLVADDVVVGDEDVVAGRADRFGLTAPAA